MIPLTLQQLAEVVSGRIVLADQVDPSELILDGPLVTDSRQAGPRGIYVARIGEHADGHAFVPAAAGNGAGAAIVSKPTEGLPNVVVDDVQQALATLSRHLVKQVPGLTVIGVTGSSGKTSTKDLLAAVLSTAGDTVAPVGSLNSEVGVPLTVGTVTMSTRFLVVEMGARGIGHISYLTDIAPPDIAIVLNVGTAHLGEFGSLETTAVAKRELVTALGPHGVAILNADDQRVAAMAAFAPGRVVTVSSRHAAEVEASQIVLDPLGRPSFLLRAAGEEHQVRLRLHGRHQVDNALSVAAAALECGLAPAAIATALSAARPQSRWRMEVTERSDGVTVINDAYNANPDSMRAALDALASMRADGRTIAVLGHMLELGPESDHQHYLVGQYAARSGADLVISVAGAREISRGAQEAGSTAIHVADADAAYALLDGELRAGDVVIVKSSRDAGLRFLGDQLTAPTEGI